jgi:hypothetical protein
MNANKGSREVKTFSVHPIAALYQRSVLDPMVEIARTISHDFIRRPQNYRAVSVKTAQILEGFRVRIGSSPEWLSPTQRGSIFVSLFGAAFCSTSIGLRIAVLDLVERQSSPNPDIIHGVRDTALAFRGYLGSIDGRVISVADSETNVVFQSAVDVFRDGAVAGVFGLPAAPGGNWPFDGTDTVSSDGAYLLNTMPKMNAHESYEYLPFMRPCSANMRKYL